MNLIVRLPHIQGKRREYFPLLNIQEGNISETGGKKGENINTIFLVSVKFSPLVVI
jgi:hypothetical protein